MYHRMCTHFYVISKSWLSIILIPPVLLIMLLCNSTRTCFGHNAHFLCSYILQQDVVSDVKVHHQSPCSKRYTSNGWYQQWFHTSFPDPLVILLLGILFLEMILLGQTWSQLVYFCCHDKGQYMWDCDNSISSPSIWNLDMVVLRITYAPFRCLHGHVSFKYQRSDQSPPISKGNDLPKQ